MSGISNVFGYFNSNSIVGTPWDNRAFEGDRPKKSHWIPNTLHVAGYFPILGLISGIFRICYAIVSEVNKYTSLTKDGLKNKVLQFRVALIARGVVECAGLGWLFLVPDIIVSINRNN